jgi:putative ABC transport system ATP-binding protein
MNHPPVSGACFLDSEGETIMSQSTVMAVENLGKRFRQGSEEITALAGVSFAIGRGTFTAVMGASGSGKTTLLNLLAGLLKPDEGRILLDGEDFSSLKDAERARLRRRRIGFVFQDYNLLPNLTLAENVRLPRLLDEAPEGAEAWSAEILEFLGLGARLKHLPAQLSGGERQRAAIARALAMKPEIVLADEPTGNLDLRGTAQVCELLRRLCRERGCTVLAVTHAPHVAIHADRVLMIGDGRLLADRPMSDFADAEQLAIAYQRLLAPATETRP